ncbi:MAG: DNA polymerase III subunit beta [Candidatus Eremiobacteraeota bacterium]|nr:DNA polymerase III subunit beta [Candidatus Eremiobacteraeota bacterium]
MRATIHKKDLENAISIASNAISQKSPLPILSHFLINAETGRLKVSATDLELGIECVTDAQVIEEGSFTTPADKFKDIVKLLPDEDLSLQKDGEELEVKCSSSNYRFMTLPPDEFPLIPRFDEKPDIVISQRNLKETIRSVIFATASKEETRAVLTGVLVIVKGNTADFIATDGRRLAMMKEDIERDSPKELKFVIPGHTLSEISKFLKDTDDKVRIGVKSGQVFFDTGSVFILSRILEGKFPQFEQVIPERSSKKITISRQKFLSAMRRTLIMAQEKNNPFLVKTFIKSDRLILKANTPDVGSAYEEVPCSLEGDEVEIAFNGQYFLDVLATLQDETVIFEVSNNESPGVIKPKGKDKYLYVVMPVRIKEEAAVE